MLVLAMRSLASSFRSDNDRLQLDDPYSFEHVLQRNEDGIGSLSEAEQSCVVGDMAISVSPLEPEEAMRWDVLGPFDGSMLQSDQRALIVSSAECVGGDLIERERVADPFSLPRRRGELTRPEHPTISDDRMTAALSDDPLTGLELILEEPNSFAPESFATFTGRAVPTTELGA
jgi:hypothetical protein